MERGSTRRGLAVAAVIANENFTGAHRRFAREHLWRGRERDVVRHQAARGPRVRLVADAGHAEGACANDQME